jgi:hypothetical protein
MTSGEELARLIVAVVDDEATARERTEPEVHIRHLPAL